MHRPTILVTAASGKTGAATTRRLLEFGYPVRAMVRQRDARSTQLERLGAAIVVGSLEDIVDLRTAMDGVHRAYFCPPLESGPLRKAVLFASAAREAGLEVVVALSQWVCDPGHKALHATEKWLSQQIISWLPSVDVVTINPGFFADNYMALLEPIAQLGIMAIPLGEGLNAPPSNEDIAKVIAGVLTNPGPHVGKSYRPTGPRLLSPEEIARTFAIVLGRRVKYQDAPIQLFLKAARSLGYGDYAIAQLHAFMLEYRRNAFGIGAPTDAVRELSGSPAEDFDSIVRRYVDASPFRKRTPLTQLRAVRRLVRLLLTRTPDLSAIARRLELPVTAHATLAVDSDPWRRSHEQ